MVADRFCLSQKVFHGQLMAASAGSCAHCGKQGVALKRCARCKEVSYCGAACQKAGWKGHKKTCAP
jgi:hypothetical protein